MPKKYRLVRTEVGVLDLSQVLDDQGRPILLDGVGAEVVVAEHVVKHPLVARYVGAGIQAEEIPVQVPRVPVTPAVSAPPPAPPVAKPAPTAPTVVEPEPVMASKPDPVPEVIIPDPPPVVDEPVMTTESAPVIDDEDADEDAPVRRRGKAGRSGKRSRSR